MIKHSDKFYDIHKYFVGYDNGKPAKVYVKYDDGVGVWNTFNLGKDLRIHEQFNKNPVAIVGRKHDFLRGFKIKTPEFKKIVYGIYGVRI